MAESTDIFAGVISLGPTSDHYGKDRANFEWQDKEIDLRSPKNFLSYIRKPTYIIEGELGGATRLKNLEDKLKEKPNNNVKTALVKGASHFTVIQPINAIFAQAIVESKDSLLSINMKTQIEPAYMSYARRIQETNDLRILANLRSQGYLLEGKKRVVSHFYAREKKYLTTVVTQAKSRGMSATKVSQVENNDGSVYFGTTLSKDISITSLQTLFALSHSYKEIAVENELYYNYWTIDNK